MSEETEVYQSPEIADRYVKYRPNYDSIVFDTIINFCKEQPSADFSLALDVCCGSGQSTVPLTTHFDKVIGLDISKAQISQAPNNIPNLSYRVGLAEDLSFVDSGSVDLVTVAMALHWLDLDKFYREVERVLKPGGAFVVYGYGFPLLDDPTAQDIAHQFIVITNETELLMRVCDDVKHLYPRYSLPYLGWRRNDSLQMERSLTVDELIGFLSSQTPHHKNAIDQPTGNTGQSVSQRLQSIYHREGQGGERSTVQVTWPMYMLMGHKPRAGGHHSKN